MSVLLLALWALAAAQAEAAPSGPAAPPTALPAAPSLLPAEAASPGPEPAAEEVQAPPRPDAGVPKGTPAARPRPAGSASPPAASPPAPRADQSTPDRVRVAAAARRFAEALLSRKATEVAALCASSFSFDGRLASGAEQVRARWEEVLAARDGVPEALLDLAVMPVPEAQARLGKPPKRLAPLLTPSAWVAVADLSGRALVIVFARQGSGFVATAIHG